MGKKSNRSFPAAGGLTSRREVLRRGAAIAAVSIVAPALPRFAKAQSASATFNYYISPQGNDSNPGTVSAPWAITSLRNNSPNWSKTAGKRIGLLPGTYNIAGMTSGTQAANYEYCILSMAAGTASSPTYIASSDASGNYSPRTATIVWNGVASTNGIIGPEYNSAGYVTLDGVVINGGGLAGTHIFQAFSDSMGGNYQTTAGTMPGIVVQNCEMYGIAATDVGNNDACVFLYGCNGAIVKNNYFHDVTKAAQSDHAHAIEEYGCQNNQYIYNTVVSCTGGIESKGGCGGTIVAYNYITASQYAALMGFDGGQGNPNSPNIPYSIHHNILDSNVGTAGSPCLIGDQNIVLNYQDINYYNNTIYDPRSGSQQEVRLAITNGASVTWYNNIVYTPKVTGGGNSAHPGIVNLSSGGYTTVDNNCYCMGAFNMGLDGGTYSSLAAWQSASRADAHAITGDPSFVGAITSGKGPAQFQLSSGSPCIGAGQGGVNMGAWDGKVTQIGCSFAPGAATGSSTVDPNAPVLSVS